MDLPLSQLISARFRQAPGARHVITLHRYNEFLDGMREIGLAVNPDGAVTALQASKGVYLGRTIVGYTWFVGPLEQPSPVHFGDAMQEIERFLWDEIDRQPDEEPALPFLVGDQQGAIMALAMAGAVPDLLSGVVAINATLPTVPGWEPPLAPLDGLPVLLVNSKGGESLTATLNQWGATLATVTGADAHIPPDDVRAWIVRQPTKTMRKDRSFLLR